MWLVKHDGDVYRPVQTSGFGQSTPYSAHWDVHQTSNTRYVPASASRDQTERDLQADRGHQSKTHAAILQGGEYKSQIRPSIDCHNINPIQSAKRNQIGFKTWHCIITSWVRPVGIGTSLTVGLQGILAPFPLSEWHWGPQIMLSEGCKSSLQGDEAAWSWSWLVILSGTEIKNAWSCTFALRTSPRTGV